MKPKKKETTAILRFTVEKQIPIINHRSRITSNAIFATDQSIHNFQLRRAILWQSE